MLELQNFGHMTIFCNIFKSLDKILISNMARFYDVIALISK